MKSADQSVDAQVAALHVAWADAVRQGDVEVMLNLLTADYVLWAPGVVPVRGRDAVRPILTNATTTYEITTVLQSVERIIVGDLAFERGIEVQSVRPRSGGELVERRQRVFLVLRRESDGCWRYARGMSNVGPDA
jgi:uncharacterized protein (TIGR02246 family)